MFKHIGYTFDEFQSVVRETPPPNLAINQCCGLSQGLKLCRPEVDEAADWKVCATVRNRTYAQQH